MTAGVVVMAYGTPGRLEDVEAFYTDVRRGRPPSAEQLEQLVARYRAIGGVSPLNERTAAQVAGLAAQLEARQPGGFAVAYGAKHAEPRIEQAVEALAGHGVDRLVGLVLAPHYARLSVGEYLERAATTAGAAGLAFAGIEHWHDEPALVAVLAERVADERARLVAAVGEPVEVVVTAHSLPERIVSTGDPYPAQLAETARLVAAAAGLDHHGVAWQSAGRTADTWLGPDILEVLRTLAAQKVAGVVVCPAGFTSDHLEVCYDLDVEARALAERLGLGFARTASLNDEPRVLAALAARVADVAATLP
jgi:ferrochelatase